MDKTALMTDRIPRGEVELPGVGVITVRGLSRYELLLAGKGVGEGDTLRMEQRMLAMGMVDPQMSEDDVAQWQKHSAAGELIPVVAKINELSGIGREVQKEAYKSFRDESGE